MKKSFFVVILVLVVAYVPTACFANPDRPLRVPYGKWENKEMGLILDINPERMIDESVVAGLRWQMYPGTYIEDGEIIDVIITISLWKGTQYFNIIRESDRHYESAPLLYNGMELGVRQNRLSLRTSDGDIVFERVPTY